MAMMKCPDCGQEISEHANACLHCGCPQAVLEAERKKTPPTRWF